MSFVYWTYYIINNFFSLWKANRCLFNLTLNSWFKLFTSVIVLHRYGHKLLVRTVWREKKFALFGCALTLVALIMFLHLFFFYKNQTSVYFWSCHTKSSWRPPTQSKVQSLSTPIVPYIYAILKSLVQSTTSNFKKRIAAGLSIRLKEIRIPRN